MQADAFKNISVKYFKIFKIFLTSQPARQICAGPEPTEQVVVQLEPVESSEGGEGGRGNLGYLALGQVQGLSKYFISFFNF